MKKIRLGIIGNSSQVRQQYIKYLCAPAKLPCEVEIAWVSGCLCASGSEYDECPFRASKVPVGLRLGFDPVKTPPCVTCGNAETWRDHVRDKSTDAVLVSLPNHLHSAPIKAFLKSGVAVAADKPPVVHADEARKLVALAERKKTPFVTLAQRRFEDVYRLMAEKIHNGEMGQIQLINLLFVHGWTPMPPGWRSKKSLAGGGVLIDSIFNCLDVLLWLLGKSAAHPKPASVHAHWDVQDPNDPETVELRITVGLKFDTGCLVNITGASTSVAQNSVDENIKIFGSNGILRYQRDKISRESMAAGQLTFQSRRFPGINQVIVPAGQSEGLREAPFADFLRCVHDPNRSSESPARDSIQVLEIIEKAYHSAANGGIPVNLI